MDLNALPDTVLRAVFDRVPLSDLVRHIPLVCHRWHALQLSVFSSKKAIALTILVGPNADAPNVSGESSTSILHGDQLTNEDGSQMFPSPMDDPRMALTLTLSGTLTTFTSKLVDSLIEKLRNVTYFKLCYRERSSFLDLEIPLIGRLLDHWARSLVTLKLRCTFTTFRDRGSVQEKVTDVTVKISHLFETVNSLPLLEHLTLDFPEDLTNIKSLDFPILGRLKEFFFETSGYSPSDLLFASLDRYAKPNDKLRSIGLGNRGRMTKYLNKFGHSSLAKRFIMLPHYYFEINEAEREHFLNTFSSLTSFTINMKGLNLARLTATLAPLTSLVHLYLSGEHNPLWKPFSDYDDEPADQIRPLASVKVLTLMAVTREHSDFASPHWARMFPNLQIINLLHHVHGCHICNLANVRQCEPEKLKSCIQRTLLPFNQQFGRTLKKMYWCNGAWDDIRVFTPDTIIDVYPSEDE